MIARCLVVPLALVLMLASAALAMDYRFTLDGKPLKAPDLTPLGDGPHPGPGDLLRIGNAAFILDGPGHYAFTWQQELRWSFDGGAESPVQVKLQGESTAQKDPDGSSKFVFRNPLAAMTPAERGRIRHLVFGSRYGTTGVLADSLSGLDWQRVVVEIEEEWPGETGLPPVPAEVRHLMLDPHRYPNKFHFAPIARLTQLRYLTVSGQVGDNDTDLALLATCPELRHLGLSGQHLKPGSRLPALARLRSLRIAYCKEADDVLWPATIDQLTGAAALEILTFSESSISTLAGLGAWKRLRTLHCSKNPIQTLPDAVGPDLRLIEAYGAPVPSEQASAFRSRHPTVDLRISWSDAIADLDGCDRIVLRTGGTCHRNPKHEKQLWVSDDRREITAFLATMAFDDRSSGHHCMCCGSATVELHRGGQVAASFGMHHGVSVRWAEGPWPGDAVLSSASREAVAGWLTDHGEHGAPGELRAQKAREAAEQRVAEHWSRVLGPTFLDEVRASGSMAGAKKLVAAKLPAGAQRTATILRLSGGSFPSWRVTTVFDQLLVKDDDGYAVTIAALTTSVQPLPDAVEIRDGICRQLFGWRRLSKLDEQVRITVGPTLARHGLADPRHENRLDVVHTLAEDGAPWCRAALRDALAGITPRPLPPEAAETPGGQVTYLPRKTEIPDDCGLSAAAALALLHIGDRDSLPAIRSALERMDAAERKVVEAALNKPPTTP